MSTSPVRVKVTVRLSAQPLLVVTLYSPAMVPSGCGCSLNTPQVSAVALLHVSEPRPTASQRPPTSSNTNAATDVVRPLRRDAVATHPPERHTDRTAHVAVAEVSPWTCLPSRSVRGAKLAV